MITLAMVVGCTTKCGPDEAVTADGCVPAATPVAWDEDTLPGYRLRECRMEPGDGRLDFVNGCANGVCWDDTYADFVTTLGTPDEVDGTSSFVTVDWDDVGMYGFFRDQDGDNRADDTAVPEFFVVRERIGGSSTEGLRVDVSLACFVQVLGQPDDIDTENDLIQTLWFDDLGVRVSDYSGQNFSFDPDGYVDTIAFDERP